jgi:hypothetical protein
MILVKISKVWGLLYYCNGQMICDFLWEKWRDGWGK